MIAKRSKGGGLLLEILTLAGGVTKRGREAPTAGEVYRVGRAVAGPSWRAFE